MFGIDVITSYLLVIAIATLLLAVLIWQTHRSGRTVIVWLAASMLGLILGSIGSYAAMRSAGYVVVKAPEQPTDAALAGPVAMPGGGMGMGGMGGGMSKGGGMGMGGMGGGMGGPQPKRDLTTLVRKLDLLTGDIAVILTTQQTAAVNECLNEVEKSPRMSDDEAKAKHDKLLAVFDDAQKARFEQIGLPRPAGGAGGPGGMSAKGGGPMGMGSGMMGKGGGGDSKQDPDQNPFQQDANGKALKNLRDRLTTKAAAEKPKPGAEAPKPTAEPPKAGAGKPKPSTEAPKAADKAPAKKS